MKHTFLQCRAGEIFCGETPVLLRGFGLNGWLLPEGYMWQMEGAYDRPRRIEQLIESLCGAEYAASFWETYEKHYIMQTDISWIAGKGFNSVRLPLNARRLFRFEHGKAEFVPGTLACVDRLIDWCREFGVYVILDTHAAPGGQTGQNIDDCEHDLPELFTNEVYQDQLCQGWELLAKRYADEPVVAAYDLLNEPLPDFFCQYNDRLLPLYRRLIRQIRAIDPNHMIMLEGAHWATDFSVLNDMSRAEAAENIALQFHRYWSAPDEESLDGYRQAADRLGVPLYLGESGENNLEWYTAMFPLCERLHIGWSFWSYKKMACENSPVTFARPAGWDLLMEQIRTGAVMLKEQAQKIFDEFLFCISTPMYNDRVLGALTRTPPFVLPCEAFDESRIVSRRMPGAKLRPREQATLLFQDGHQGEPDYRRLKGEPQPPSENIVVRLYQGDEIRFLVRMENAPACARFHVSGEGRFEVRCNDAPLACEQESDGAYAFCIHSTGESILSVRCTEKNVDADYFEFL